MSALWRTMYNNNKGNKMRKIILTQPGCVKCKSLAARCPDAEVVELDQALLLSLARAVNITSLPIVVLTGDVDELGAKIK